MKKSLKNISEKKHSPFVYINSYVNTGMKTEGKAW